MKNWLIRSQETCYAISGSFDHIQNVVKSTGLLTSEIPFTQHLHVTGLKYLQSFRIFKNWNYEKTPNGKRKCFYPYCDGLCSPTLIFTLCTQLVIITGICFFQ